MEKINFCGCGCGDIAKPGRRFIYHHHLRGLIKSRSAVRKNRISHIGLAQSVETREKRRLASMGNTSRLGQTRSEEEKDKQSETMKYLWSTPEFRDKMISLMPSYIRKPERLAKISASTKQRWSNPEYKNSTVRAIVMGSNGKMTKPEGRLLSIIEDWSLPFEYNGQGPITIGGLCPDFTPTNGCKGLLEVYGDYIHEGECESYKEERYNQEGYGLLVFWAHELDELSEETIVYLIIDFYLRHVNPEPSPSNESLVDGKVQRLGNEELEPISPK